MTLPTSTRSRCSCPGTTSWWTCSANTTTCCAVIEAALPGAHPRPGQRDHGHRAMPESANRVGRLFEELVVLVEQGHPLDRDGVDRAHRDGEVGSAAERRAAHRGRARPQERPAEDRGPEAVRRRGARPHGHVRDRSRRYRQELPRRSRSRCRRCRRRPSTASSSRVPRSKRASDSASCPATCSRRSTRTSVRSTTRCTTCSIPRRRAPHGPRRHRGRAARLHARPHAQRLVHHPRRGAEHDGRADEDVPHPSRVRLEDRRHGRRHPDRPARRPRAFGPARGARHPRGRRRPGVRRARFGRRRAPPHRAGHRRRLRRERRRAK